MVVPAVGVDIESVARFEQANPRLFTSAEIEHSGGRAQSLAGIWCAKEAVVKAVCRWQEIHVRNVEVGHDGDRPVVVIPGFEIDVSISHTDDYAVAVAIALPHSDPAIR